MPTGQTDRSSTSTEASSLQVTLVGDKLAKTNQQCQVSTQLRDEVMLKEISRAVAGACTRENEKIDAIDQRENSILVRQNLKQCLRQVRITVR